MNFKLVLDINENDEIILCREYEDLSRDLIPEYKIKTINGFKTILFVDGTRLPMDMRTEIVLSAYEAATRREDKVFYLGPRYNTFVKDALDYLFFENDGKGNKLFITDTIPMLDDLLRTVEALQQEEVELGHEQLISTIIANNTHFVDHLMSQYETTDKNEALSRFMEDLARETEFDNPDAPFMPSTGYDISDEVGLAILGDGESAYANSRVLYDEVLLSEGLRKHENGNGDEGFWEGVALSYVSAPVLGADSDEVIEYDVPTGILFAIEDLEVEGQGGIQTYNFALPDGGILVAPVPEAPKPELVATKVEPLELHVTENESEVNPNGEGLAVYWNFADKPQRTKKRIYWQWIGQDGQYSSIRSIDITLDVTKSPFAQVNEIEVEDELKAAFLVDVDGEPSVYESKSIDGNTITIKGLKFHKAGNGMNGYWAGFALVDKEGTADQIILSVNGEVFDVKPLESKVDGERDGVAYYFNVENEGKTTLNVEYQWFKEGKGSPVSRKDIVFDVTFARIEINADEDDDVID